MLSTLCLGLVSVMASFTALWLVDVSLRAQYVKRQDRLLREGGDLDGDDGDGVAVQAPVSTRDHHVSHSALCLLIAAAHHHCVSHLLTSLCAMGVCVCFCSVTK